MRFLPIVLATAMSASLVYASVANGARLVSSHGQILVDNGNGFRPATNGMLLNSGDRVMAKTDGTADIDYTECIETVVPGAVVTVDHSAPCRAHATTSTESTTPRGIDLGSLLTAAGVAAVTTAVGKRSSLPSSP